MSTSTLPITSTPKASPTKAYVYFLVGCFCYSTYTLFIHLLTDISPTQLCSIICLLCLIVNYVGSFLHKDYKLAAKNNPTANKLLILRGMCLAVMMLMSNYGQRRTLLGEGLTLFQLTPTFLGIMSSIILKEKITKTQVSFIIVSLVGALFIVKPEFLFNASTGGGTEAVQEIDDNGEHSLGCLAILVSVFMFSCQLILSKILCNIGVPSDTIVTDTFLFGSISYAPMNIFDEIQTISAWNWILILGMVLFYFLANKMINRAISMEDVSKLSIVTYTEPIFGYFYDAVLLGGQIDGYSIVGCSIVFSCIFIQLYQVKTGKGK